MPSLTLSRRIDVNPTISHLWNTIRRFWRRDTYPEAQILVPRVWTQHPQSPPPIPDTMLANRDAYEAALYRRRLLRLQRETDTPLHCLYRLYECIVLDYNIGMRNEIEYFFRQHTWPVRLIPDPMDEDPARYAVFACIPYLLVEAFNHNIELGLPRNAPAIMTDEEIDEVQTRPKIYEEVPEWAMKVPPLEKRLVLPHYEHQMTGHPITLPGFEDDRASDIFKAKNILVCGQHIYFI